MSHNAALAEVKFPQYAINLYGRVEQMSRSSIRVRLETQPAAPHVLQVGNEAHLMVVAKGVIYRASVRVSEMKASSLTMQFDSPPHAVQRRNANRRPCDFNISFRTLNNGCAGAWQGGAATDVSAGGMRVVLDRRVDLSGEVELLFLIDDFVQAQESPRKGSEAGPENAATSVEARPIKATARITHRAMLAEGGMTIGLSFRKLSSFDQLRLLRYADADGLAQML